MNKQDKELLLKDLCGRLPYGVAIIPDGQTTPYRVVDIDFNKEVVVVKPKDRELIGVGCLGFEDFKLILRPMSSMTKEERKEYWDITSVSNHCAAIDYLNANHFDYRGLIERGLALKALEGMYEY